ncbi:MAG: glycosyltransferase family 2 protein [Acidimicrobiales bacterium]|nr:glycosyltransferase family 2 protein [Acidimicrobiales bacterium]
MAPPPPAPTPPGLIPPGLARISVVVPVYGGWEYVHRLLTDLQAVPAIAEIVVVDDAHPEPPPADIEQWHRAVRYHRRSTNGGFAAAVNTGVEHAHHEVVLVLNADLCVDPTMVAGLHERVVAEPEAIHGPQIDSGEGPQVDQQRPFPTQRSLLLEFLVPLRLAPALDRRLRGLDHQPATEPVDVDWLSGACLGFTRATFATIGPLDERFGMYVEDAEWQHRAHRLGVARRYHPDLVVRHDIGHGAFRDQARVDERYLAAWAASLTLLDMRGAPMWLVRALLGLGAIVNTPFVLARQLGARLGRIRRGPSLAAYWRVPRLPTRAPVHRGANQAAPGVED